MENHIFPIFAILIYSENNSFESRGYFVPSKKDKKEENEYKEKVISLLESIKSNTDNLDILVKLTHENNDKQDEIIEITKELHQISKCTDKEQAKTKYRKVMDKIHSLNTGIDTVVKLTGYATTFYTVLHTAGIV